MIRGWGRAVAGAGLRESEEGLDEPLGVGRRGCDFGWVERGQDAKAVVALTVAALSRALGGAFEAVEHVLLWDLFDLRVSRQRLRPKASAVEILERFAVSEEP